MASQLRKVRSWWGAESHWTCRLVFRRRSWSGMCRYIHWHSGSCLADLSKFPFKIKLFSFIKRKKKKANLLRQQTWLTGLEMSKSGEKRKLLQQNWGWFHTHTHTRLHVLTWFSCNDLFSTFLFLDTIIFVRTTNFLKSSKSLLIRRLSMDSIRIQFTGL